MKRHFPLIAALVLAVLGFAHAQFVPPRQPAASEKSATRGRELIDLSCASGAACDTGVLDTTAYSNIFINVSNTGAGISGTCVFSVSRDDGTLISIGAGSTVAAGSAAQWGWSVSGLNMTGTNTTNIPFPRRGKIACAGAVNAIIRITVQAR